MGPHSCGSPWPPRARPVGCTRAVCWPVRAVAERSLRTGGTHWASSGPLRAEYNPDTHEETIPGFAKRVITIRHEETVSGVLLNLELL